MPPFVIIVNQTHPRVAHDQHLAFREISKGGFQISNPQMSSFRTKHFLHKFCFFVFQSTFVFSSISFRERNGIMSSLTLGFRFTRRQISDSLCLCLFVFFLSLVPLLLFNFCLKCAIRGRFFLISSLHFS